MGISLQNTQGIVEKLTEAISSGQSLIEIGSSENAHEAFTNTLNLAGGLLATSPWGIGLNSAATVNGTATVVSKWTRGELEPSDIAGLTATAMSLATAAAFLAGAPVTTPVLLISFGVSLVTGWPLKDGFNDVAGHIADAITGTSVPGVNAPLTPPMDPAWGRTLSVSAWLDPMDPDSFDLGVPVACNRNFAAAVSWTAPRDPLVLDLDGDGIEAVGIDPNAPILFDHNADGVRTSTGWVRGDDGFVVLDRNGNGTIDSGRELFGDNTALPSGALASNGFAALAQHDGNADGRIDSADAAYSQLRIWRDLNQDGISQAGELATLAASGVASIGTQALSSNTNLGNGNTLAFTGSFTRTDGQTGTTTVSGSLLLASNAFFRQFTDDPTPTAQAVALPELLGSGWVRDLRSAMSLGTPEADALQQQVSQFAAATTREAQLALLPGVLRAWAQTSGRLVASTEYAALVEEGGMRTTGDGSTGTRLHLLPAGMTTSVSTPTGTQVQATAQGLEFLATLHLVEVFNGSRFVQIAAAGQAGGNFALSNLESGSGATPTYRLDISTSQVDLIRAAARELSDAIYGGLVTQTRLKPYLYSLELRLSQDGLSWSTTALDALLEARRSADPRQALVDLIELGKYAQDRLQAAGFPATARLRAWIDALPAASPLRAELPSLGVSAYGQGAAGESADIVLGDAGNNAVSGAGGNDVLDAGAGNDNVQGGWGDDTMDGGAGNDTLSGDYHNTFHGWYGGTGNDTYLFGRGDGQDMIYDTDGTAGNIDRIVFKPGVAPHDVLVCRSGNQLVLRINGTTDQITVNRWFDGDGVTSWSIEQVCFADGTVWDVATLKARHLLATTGNDDMMGYATNDVVDGGDGNDRVAGAGGNDTVRGGNGNDTVDGNDGDDRLEGGAGDDALAGGGHNDLLIAGAGNDVLQAGWGDDTLDGGAGNDTLSGDYHNTFQGWYSGAGNDTYLFGRGDGQDMIYDTDATAGNLDRIVFKAGVLPQDVLVRRNGSHLVLSIAGTTDQVTVNRWFDNEGASTWLIEQVAFEDGTVWDVATLKARQLLGAPGNDNITGYSTHDLVEGGDGNDTVAGAGGEDTLLGGNGNDVLDGGDGNDTIDGGAGDEWLSGAGHHDLVLGGSGNDNVQGGWGDDTMEGGAGNDTLSGDFHDFYWGRFGGAGNDTYRFGRGDGQDTIYDTDTTAGNIDRIVFKAGIAPQDVMVRRNGNHMIVSIPGTTDQITVNGWFTSDGTSPWTIEQFVFDDGTVWDVAAIKARQLVSTAGNDNLVAYASADLLDGGDGNDSLSGAAGNDTIVGGTGNDVRDGDDGADSLDGGIGDDWVSGGGHNDILIAGSGNDNVQGGWGDDTMEGGTGNDTLSGDFHNFYWGSFGGAGSDTYRFGRGDGQDWIYDTDTTAGNLDRIVFKAGIAAQDVTVRRHNGGNLQLSINGTTDQILVARWFEGDGATPWNIEQVVFDDGTTWDVATVKALQLVSTAGADNLAGYASADLLDGGDGNDNLSGAAGNDTILGGTGNDGLNGDDGADSLDGGDGDDWVSGGGHNDILIAGSGNDNVQGGWGDDTMEGGTGNDTLSGDFHNFYWGSFGGAGNDTYRFGRGDGQDMVYDNDSTAGNQDRVQFGAGIAHDQLWLRQVNSNLEVSLIGTTDKVTVANWYSHANWRMELFEAGGRTLTGASVQNLVQAMASFAPPAAGQTTLPENYRSSLDSVIAAHWQ